MRPGLWIQIAAQRPTDALELVEAFEGHRPGVVISPEHQPATLQGLYERARSATSVLIDPSGFLFDRPATKRARRHYPWLAEGTLDATSIDSRGWPRPDDATEWAHWMRAGVEHQHSFTTPESPSAEIIPTPQLVASGGRDNFDHIANAFETVHREYPNAWLGLNIDRDYLREEEHLTRLVNYLIAEPAQGLMLRCFQSEMPPISDRRLLQGLSDLVGATAGEGVAVILPRSGWLGWLAMAWGAHGFSGGLSNGTWYDRMPTPMANTPRREKIFERQILRDVPWSVHQQLSGQNGYQPCECVACIDMDGSFDTDLARVHRILSAVEIAEVGTADPSTEIADRVNAAVEFRDSLPTVLQERADARFLDVWQALL